jgi:hypothetical protein
MPIGTEFVHDASTTNWSFFLFRTIPIQCCRREKAPRPRYSYARAPPTAKAYVTTNALYDERMNVWSKEGKSLIPRNLWVAVAERIKYVQRTTGRKAIEEERTRQASFQIVNQK